jgi:ribonuclease HII
MASKSFVEKVLIRRGIRLIAGVDEVGRGPLAGPVVACAVILPLKQYRSFEDSKLLSPARREKLYQRILKEAVSVGLGALSSAEVDRINIHRATLQAMAQAVERLSPPPEFILVDGLFPVPVPIPQETLVKGESRSFSIAAASIVAKVVRDRLMDDMDRLFPVYNFKTNRGYGTREHRLAIRNFGVCPWHRATFRGVKEYCGKKEARQLLLFGNEGGNDCRDLSGKTRL